MHMCYDTNQNKCSFPEYCPSCVCTLHAGSGANTDFTASSVTLTFDPSSNLECIDIPVTNDDDIENDESFLVGLMTDDPDVTLDPRDGDVLIVDDDGINVVHISIYNHAYPYVCRCDVCWCECV